METVTARLQLAQATQQFLSSLPDECPDWVEATTASAIACQHFIVFADMYEEMLEEHGRKNGMLARIAGRLGKAHARKMRDNMRLYSNRFVDLSMKDSSDRTQLEFRQIHMAWIDYVEETVKFFDGALAQHPG